MRRILELMQAEMILLVLAFVCSSVSDIAADREALLDFIRGADVNNVVRWNTSSANPCNKDEWPGVECQEKFVSGRVSSVTLVNVELQGRILENTLSRLTELRKLTLKNTSLIGSIPLDLANCTALKKLSLQNNRLNGTIPASLGSLQYLDRLQLNNNQLQGLVPPQLNKLRGLLTLRLENNSLEGSLPDMTFPKLEDFNVSYNNFVGPVGKSLAIKYPTAFQGMDGLCGVPDRGACPPSSSPETASVSTSKKLSIGSIIAIIIFCAAIVALVTIFLTCYHSSRDPIAVEGKLAAKNEAADDQSLDSASLKFPEEGAEEAQPEAGKLIFVDEEQEIFDLKDLLRASAELLGKGTVGTTYKAVMSEGVILAVKRLIDRSVSDKGEFEQQMAMVGKLKHVNLVPLVAYYYYAKEEKLLVYEYLPNKNLYTLLHGNRGTPERVPLNWIDRLNIAHGVAQGLAFLHQQCTKSPHGSIKSTNIIFDQNNRPRIADFGLLPFMNGHQLPQGNNDGYRAPEMHVTKKVTHKADVYSFGVMLLELLTGRVAARQGSNVDLPKWVNSVVREEWTAEVFDYELATYRKNVEEEMVYLLRIAMDCVNANPEQRPKMSQVLKMIEDIVEARCNEGSFSSDLPSSTSASIDFSVK